MVLAETGDGRWRLWQILRARRSLRESPPTSLDAGSVLERLTDALRLVLAAEARCRSAMVPLRCSLDTIARGTDGTPRYVALMPAAQPAAVAGGVSASELAAELVQLAQGCMGGSPAAARAWRSALETLGAELTGGVPATAAGARKRG